MKESKGNGRKRKYGKRKNAFDGLFGRLDSRGQITELEDRLIKLSKLKYKEKKTWKKIRKEHLRIVGEFQIVQRVYLEYRKTHKEQSKINIFIMATNIVKIIKYAKPQVQEALG